MAKSTVNNYFDLSGAGLQDLHTGVRDDVVQYHGCALASSMPSLSHLSRSRCLHHRILRDPQATQQDKDRAGRMLKSLRTYDLQKTAMYLSLIVVSVVAVLLLAIYPWSSAIGFPAIGFPSEVRGRK